LPNSSADSNRSRGNNERRQWAAAVVKKATPTIVESLIDAAEALGEPTPAHQSKPASHSSEEGEDESLAVHLLRLLRTPDTVENSQTDDAGANAVTTAGENPSVG